MLALTVGACGLPSDGHIERLEPSSVPFGLLAPAESGSPAPPPRGPSTNVYLVRNDRLATATRTVLGENVPAEAVRLLLDGPLPEEAVRGLTTAVPSGTRLISLDLARGVATIDLSPEFGTLGGSEQVLAVAQLVYTLTASKYINAVRFAINGKAVEVPDGSGSLARAARSREDYRQLAPHQ
jgi:spore germination protein GerM